MTAYVILEAINDSGTQFAVVGEQEAGTGVGAIRTFADGKPGVYASVPKRSWVPVKLSPVEVKPRLRFDPL